MKKKNLWCGIIWNIFQKNRSTYFLGMRIQVGEKGKLQL